MHPHRDPAPPPPRWLYVLVIFMTLALVAAFLAVIYGLSATAQHL